MLNLKTYTPDKLWRTVKNTILVVLGTAVLSFGVGIFAIPFNLVTGGVTGLCIVLHELLCKIPLFADVTVAMYVTVINWTLFILGLIFLGRAFAAKTLVSTIVYPLTLSLFSSLASSDLFGGLFNFLSDNYSLYGKSVVIVAAVFAGALIGVGCSLTFLGGGSTGGLDILAFIICKYIPSIKSSKLIFVLDAGVVLLGIFAIKDLIISLLGIVSALICAFAVDKIFLGGNRAFVAHIVSQKYSEINSEVIRRLRRTTTIVDAVGGFSGSDRKMVIVTFGYAQYAEFTAMLSAIDKNAFVTVHRAHEINGEGWTFGLHSLKEIDAADTPTEEGDDE